MTEVADVVNFAWNKDAVNLKTAINDIMAAKVSDSIANYTQEFASSIFSATSGEEISNESGQSSEPVGVETNENI